jgi:hypothetical protein
VSAGDCKCENKNLNYDVFPLTTIPQIGTSKFARTSSGERDNLNEYPPKLTSKYVGIDPVSSNSGRRVSLVKSLHTSQSLFESCQDQENLQGQEHIRGLSGNIRYFAKLK